jgi:6-phosphogluconolactonase
MSTTSVDNQKGRGRTARILDDSLDTIRAVAADVRTAGTLAETSRLVAEELVRVFRERLESGNHAAVTIALAGGNTPRTLYRLLASDFREQIPWERLHVFWGDERYVHPEDPRSNYRMARTTLLDHVPIPADRIHAIPTGFSHPDEAAAAYAGVLREVLGETDPQFDVILLGLGTDGHTASLFPQSPALREQARSVVAVMAPVPPPARLTLTLPVLTRALHVFVLLEGAAKIAALDRVLAPGADPNRYPAAGLIGGLGRLIWWVARMP